MGSTVWGGLVLAYFQTGVLLNGPRTGESWIADSCRHDVRWLSESWFMSFLRTRCISDNTGQVAAGICICRSCQTKPTRLIVDMLRADVADWCLPFLLLLNNRIRAATDTNKTNPLSDDRRSIMAAFPARTRLVEHHTAGLYTDLPLRSRRAVTSYRL